MLDFIVDELKPVYDYINDEFEKGTEYIVIDHLCELFIKVDYVLLQHIIYKDKSFCIRREFVKWYKDEYINEYKQVIVNPKLTEYRVIYSPIKYEGMSNTSTHRDFLEMGIRSKVEEVIDLIEENDDILFSNLNETNIILGKRFIWEVRKIKKGEKK